MGFWWDDASKQGRKNWDLPDHPLHLAPVFRPECVSEFNINQVSVPELHVFHDPVEHHLS
jgi:hypothetical protein